MHNTCTKNGNMENDCPEKRTIRFRGTCISETNVSSNNKRVENVDFPNYKSQLSKGQSPEKKSGIYNHQRNISCEIIVIIVLVGGEH